MTLGRAQLRRRSSLIQMRVFAILTGVVIAAAIGLVAVLLVMNPGR
jgi:hypothetical protein